MEDFPTVEPTPEPTVPPTPVPTETPTPLPQADITVNNNSSWNVNVYIGGILEGAINAGDNNTYTKDIGNYDLIAQVNSGEHQGEYWSENIDLTITAYIWNLEPGIESYPENCRVFNFEDNYEDHLGIDDWNSKIDLDLNSSVVKYGSYSLTGMSGNLGIIRTNDNWGTIGESQSCGFWIYIDDELVEGLYSLLSIYSSIENVIRIRLEIDDSGIFPIMIIEKGNIETILEGDYIDTEEWYYVGICYNSGSNTAYFVVNDTINTISPSGTWTGSNNFLLQLTIANYTNIVYNIDELCIVADKFIDPQVFVDHYNHNVPWEAEYVP